MARVYLLVATLMMVAFVSAIPSEFEKLGFEVVQDRCTTCYWKGSAPFCRSASYYTDDNCGDDYPTLNGWYVDKTEKKNCWTGKKAYCCRNYC